MDKTYLSPGGVTEMFPGVSEGQLAQWRYRGVGGPPYRKLGKTIVYELGEVLEWAESNTRTSTAEQVPA